MNEEDFERKYYGKNYSLVKQEEKIGLKKMKETFLKQYPFADISKFSFEMDFDPDGSFTNTKIYFINSPTIQTDIDSETFKNDPNMTKYLTWNKPVSKFPTIWKSNGSIQEIPKSNPLTVEGMTIWDQFPNHLILNYPFENFRIFVNEKDSFLSRLPLIEISMQYWKGNWDDNESYFCVCFAVYCASYCCGISIQHLTPSSNVFPVITSVMRFHLYFTVRRLLRQMESREKMSDISREFNASEFYQNNTHIRKKMIYRQKGGVVYQLFPDSFKNDYKRYIPVKSNDFTKIGLQYLNQSIESFVYSILGSQARTKQSIFSNRASALETQKEFRKIVEDSVVNYDTATWINNMNVAITATHVILNVAISPTLWLIPSSLIILKQPIEGFNNKLKVSSDEMVFGLNKTLNFFGEDKTKLEGNEIKNETNKNEIKNETNKNENKNEANQTQKKTDIPDIKPSKIIPPKTEKENVIILILALLGGFTISKFLF